jgi:hypothetical protein
LAGWRFQVDRALQCGTAVRHGDESSLALGYGLFGAGAPGGGWAGTRGGKDWLVDAWGS